MRKVLAILRAERFSPNAVDNDAAILAAVVERLRRRGFQTATVGEDEIARLPQACPGGDTPWAADAILTMGRRPDVLAWLESQADTLVINRPEAIARCRRSVVERILAEEGIPAPPADGPDGYWLKRADEAAQERGDVVFAANRQQLADAVSRFAQRGIDSYTVSAHVPGDVVKFYGVGTASRKGQGRGFFRYCYPSDCGHTKFGDETVNGPAHHYPFPTGELQRQAERLAAAVGVKVYGGDAIVRQDGTFCFIDFNDWPSFAPCRDEAAEAIAALVDEETEGEGLKS